MHGALGLGIIRHQTYEHKINAHNECAQGQTGDGQAARQPEIDMAERRSDRQELWQIALL